jgi:archaeosine synthase
MIDVLNRVGVARNARWSVVKRSVPTPNIAFLRTSSYPGPEFAELVLDTEAGSSFRMVGGPDEPILRVPDCLHVPRSRTKDEGTDGGCFISNRLDPGDGATIEILGEVAVLENAFELRRDARAFVQALAELRERVGYTRLIYAPGAMDLSNLALFAYLGVDLFDSSLLMYRAANGQVSLPEGNLPAEKADWLLKGAGQGALVDMNLRNAWNELHLVRHMMSAGRLRELAEVRSQATPFGVAALRLFDLEHYALQERYTPLTGPRFYANTKQSLYRPDVWRWRRRIMERWTPAPHKKVLLLIPCSARKPYFMSRSHQLFREVLMSVPNPGVVQELIVTSPIGVVPRELELFYPAAQYDIPVTGHWDREEVAMVQQLVAHAASFGFERVISHLGAESEFVQEVAPQAVDTSAGSTTSRDALRRLQEELGDACSNFPTLSRSADRTESLSSVARFQFGPGGDALTAGCQVVGNYPYSKIMEGRVQMGMLTPERGMISLTMEGASRLLPARMNWVEMEDFDLGGNLFAVGVKGADPILRVGDEAMVIRNGELEGVGIAAMCGEEMVASKRGEAVRIRHKKHSLKG